MCGEVITLGKLIGVLFLFCLSLLSILFLKTPNGNHFSSILSVCWSMSVVCQISCVGGMHGRQSLFATHPCYSFPMRQSFSMDEKEAEKKGSLRNMKLKANTSSETEEQRKERPRIRREKDRAGRRTMGKKRSPGRLRETAPGHSQKIEAR